MSLQLMQLLVSKRLVSKLFIIVLFSLSLVNDYYIISLFKDVYKRLDFDHCY